MTASVLCGECGSPMKLRRSGFGKFYGCIRWPDCKGRHGAHQSSGLPLGVPADQKTRSARIRAHKAFDALWRSGYMKRAEAYRWLAAALDVPQKHAHISSLDFAGCERLIAAAERAQKTEPLS